MDKTWGEEKTKQLDYAFGQRWSDRTVRVGERASGMDKWEYRGRIFRKMGRLRCDIG